MTWRRLFVTALLMALCAGCGNQSGTSGGGTSGGGTPVAPAAAPNLSIVSGSENKTLEPIIQQFAQDNHVRIQMDYVGSVDMMLQLQSGTLAADAVWPANSFWVTLGDTKNRVKHSQSIMRTPVVFGVKKSVAARLGWVNKPVKVEDILKAAEAGRLHYMMTSATQSNSGASAYIGDLYAFAGRPEVLTAKNLADPTVRQKIKRFLGTVNRSAGSSGWLKDLFLSQYGKYDAMINYEAVVIEANQQLTAQGREPLYVVYPEDGLAIADSPLGYVDRGDAAKEKLFLSLQQFLLSPDAQNKIQAQGRRVGLVGVGVQNPDPAVFNPAWGIDTKRVLTPIRFPEASVVRQALDLYQTAFRKPSLTVYCIDFSGSMTGNGGEQGVKSAMSLLLDQDKARPMLLQASPDDVTVVIPFNDHVITQLSVRGNDPAALRGALAKINALQADGGTDIYTPVMRGLDVLRRHGDLNKYFPAIILMTDGQSNTGSSFADLQAALNQDGLGGVPVYAIQFGDADPSQLQQITTATAGKVFDGTQDLARAFREAKGYN